MELDSRSIQRTTRLAGVLYFIWILTGLYGIFYVPSQINMRGDAVTTTQNILAHEMLFRTSIVNDLFSGALWIVMVLVFYRLFKHVNEWQAKLLVALVIVQIPVGLILDAFSIASLMILKGEILKSFELAQRQEVAALFLKMSDYGILTLILYWGLWLIPLGILTYMSRFLPRFLGVWLIFNGVAYVIMSLLGVLLPDSMGTFKNVVTPILFGEMAYMLWLLIIGAKPQRVESVPVQ